MRVFSAILFVSLLAFNSFADDKWTWVGPETGKYVAEILGDPLHPQTWYAINDGKLFRSINNANSWIPTGETGTFIIHPVTGKIWLLNRNHKIRITISSSTDQARSFQFISTVSNVETIVASPIDDQFLAAINQYKYSEDSNIFILSTDSGHTWADLSAQLPFTKGTSASGCDVSDSELGPITFSPKDKNTIFLNIQYLLNCSQSWQSALMVSHDLGKTWSLTPDLYVTFQSDPNFADRVFAYGSRDVYEVGFDSLEHLTNQWISLIVTFPGNRNHLIGYLGSEAFESHDGGKNWEIGPPNGKFLGQYPVTIMKMPIGGYLLAAGEGGVYRKLPHHPWQSASKGFGNSSFVQSVASIGKTVYASMGDRFFYRSDDRGQHWTDLSPRIPKGLIVDIAVNPGNKNEVLIATRSYSPPFINFYKSMNAGKYWHFLFRKQAWSESRSVITYDERNPSTIYFVATGLFRSTEGGNNPAEIFSEPVTRIVLDPTVPDFILAISECNGIWKSVNGGRNFYRADGGIDSDPYSECGYEDVNVPSSNAPYLNITGLCNIYRSTNGANSWKPFSRLNHCATSSGGEAYGGQRIYATDNSGIHLYVTNNLWFMESLDEGFTWMNRSKLFFDHFVWWRGFSEMTDPKHKPFYVATTDGLFRHD